jgi:hypothetical protein
MKPVRTKCEMYISFWQEDLKESAHLETISSRLKSNYKINLTARLEIADWWQVAEYRMLVGPCVSSKLNY